MRTRTTTRRTRTRIESWSAFAVALFLALALGACTSTGPAPTITSDATTSAPAGPTGSAPAGPTGSAPAGPTSSAAAEPTGRAALDATVVSLTFDDGYTSQLTAADIMDSHDVKGTFYVPSGLIGKAAGAGTPEPAHMTSAQLLSLQKRGHEIGGHTVTHSDLTQMDADEAKRQVCNDRVALTDLGLRVTSFSYPFTAANEQVEQMTEECGYNSARGLGDILSPDLPGKSSDCTGCPVAETMPPAKAFRTAAPEQVSNTWTLASLQDMVTRAESTGGWLQLTFHHIDDTGGPISITPELFEEFVAWLADRTSRGTIVRTVDTVIGGTVKPVVAGPQAESRPEDGNLLVNPGLEETGPDGVHPRCWQEGGWGQNSPEFSMVGDARTGKAAGSVSMQEHADGDAKLQPMMDLGSCAPPVRPGETYELRAWYKSSRVTQFDLYTRSAAGGWNYWTSTPYFPAASTWTQVSFRTPTIPADARALSFGLNIAGNGTLVTDDYEMYHSDHVPDEQPRTGNLVVNAGMEDQDGTMPRCWQLAGWGANEADVDLVTPGRTGTAARVDMTSYREGDAKLVPAQDAGPCAPPVAPGKAYNIESWYQSTGHTQFEVYRRTEAGEWLYWTSSPYFGSADAWSQATFTTPAVPDGTTHLSFGLNIMGDGSLLTDDYRMYDSAGPVPEE